MNSSINTMREMKVEEAGDRVVKVACDMIRVLLVLGGSGWENELLEGLAALAAVQGDVESVASSKEVDTARGLLLERGLMEYRGGERADSTGRSTIKDHLYSLRDYAAAMQVFGSDKPVLLLRKGV